MSPRSRVLSDKLDRRDTVVDARGTWCRIWFLPPQLRMLLPGTNAWLKVDSARAFVHHITHHNFVQLHAAVYLKLPGMEPYGGKVPLVQKGHHTLGLITQRYHAQAR
jgi:hypothetical protein